ncbi:MAG: DUF3592 domain-containing protein [Polyangiales bacterium]
MSAIQSLVGLALTGGGVAMFPYTARLARQRREALSWPKVPGRIVHSELVDVPSNGESAPGTIPRVRFQYQVNGQTLESDRIQWGPQVVDATDGGARALVSRYPLGASVSVLVNPSDPSQAALEVPPAGNTTMYYGLGVGFLVVGLLLLLAS